MSLSKKGFRTITLNAQKYYWRFNGKITIIQGENKNHPLIVDFGWYDEWLYVNDPENKPPDFEPKIVTPKFISESIHFALENEWQDKKLEIKFQNDTYHIT